MADEKQLKQAQIVFQNLCKTLDEHDWHYKKNEDDLSIESGARGDDLPIDLNIKVDADRQVLMLLSRLPLVVPEDKRLDLAVAVTLVNNRLADGSFDYDVRSGRLYFRLTNSFLESELSGEVFMYMVICACHVVDDFNDKFLMLAKGMMSMEQFISENTNN